MIIGKKTILSPVVKNYRSKLFHWRNDRALIHAAGEFGPISEISHDQWLEAVSKRSDLFIFAILDRAKNVPIGYCMLNNYMHVHRQAKLGIAIGEPDYQNKGFGSEAVRSIADYGFRDLNLNRIWLDVFSDNAPAIRVYDKCGFKHEGVMRQHYFIDGVYKDAIIMGLLRAEWEAGAGRES